MGEEPCILFRVREENGSPLLKNLTYITRDQNNMTTCEVQLNVKQNDEFMRNTGTTQTQA